MKSKTFLFYAFSFSLLFYSCADSNTTNDSKDHSQENHQHNSSMEEENHGHNHANQHMHNTPVAELIEAFESEDRAKTQKPDEVIKLLGNIEGKKILDIGAGSGYFSYRMADQGADVIAGDVNDEFLTYLKTKNAKTKRTKGSVTPKKLPFDSPSLAVNEIDDVIIVNTYHHIEDRPNYFKKVLNGLKPGGKLMVVDFKKKHFDEKVEGPPYEMRIAASRVMQELTDAGFTRFKTNTSLLPFQYVLMAWKDRENNIKNKSQIKEEFKSLKVDKINKKLATVKNEISPKQVMEIYYPLQVNTNEGKEKITITTKNLSKEIAVVTLIHNNLLDDSMRGKKFVMELRKKGRKWMVYSIKKNWRCYRGHEYWGIENCK